MRHLSCCLLTMAALLVPATDNAAFGQSDDVAASMAAAANQFLESLDGSFRKKAQFGFESAERLNWHFIPRDRNGVGLWDIEGRAAEAASELVKSGLSAAGYEKSLQVRSLEEVLYLFEGGEEAERRAKRHPHKYYLTIFGVPGDSGAWGWRFEGHHISLNYTLKDGQIVGSTPEFLGANPGLIEAGPGRSLRVLGRREELARQILHACSDEQKKTMWVSEKPPGEVRGAGNPVPVVSEAVGLAFSDMSTEQQGLLKELLGVYLAAMPAPVVRDRMQAIEKGGMQKIHIAWWGGSELNEPHHYVVQGPSFIIEYNNTQNSANHVHSMWRNTAGDFGNRQ